MSAASGEPIADVRTPRLAQPRHRALLSCSDASWAMHWPAELAEVMLASVSLAGHDRRCGVQPLSDRPKRRSGFSSRPTATRVVGIRHHDAEPEMTMPTGCRTARSMQLVVDPAAQHRGHGSRLLNACADTLRARWICPGCLLLGERADDDASGRFLIARWLGTGWGDPRDRARG